MINSTAAAFLFRPLIELLVTAGFCFLFYVAARARRVLFGLLVLFCTFVWIGLLLAHLHAL